MKYENRGGNRINRKIDSKIGEILADHRYFYALIGNDSSTAYINSLYFKKVICHIYKGCAKIQNLDVLEGDFFFNNDSLLEIKPDPESVIMIAGIIATKIKIENTRNGHVRQERELKIVTKPWGYEVWVTGEDPDFCFKKIFMRSGNRTSLQFHEKKSETNLIVSGLAEFVFKANSEVDNLLATEADLAKVELNSFCAIDVAPLCLHRIESITDLLLFEVSTPEVDDVIRVLDDSGRSSGRIQNEHQSRQ
jgi:mannose-6-phosphate isomerase